ncbi:MAG: hypothetical protein AAFQ65_00560 [Myxococcota bacterium]
MKLRDTKLLILTTVWAGTLGACLEGLEVSSSPTVSCTDDIECTTGFVCSESLGRCVLASGLGGDGPTLVGAVTPANATTGTEVAVEFTASRNLGQLPMLRLQSADGETNPIGENELILQRAIERNYVYTFLPSGEEAEREYSVVANLVDESGNTSENLVVGTLTLDYSPPLAATVAVTPSVAQVGTEVRVRVSASEAIDVRPGREPTLSLLWPGGLQALALEDTTKRAPSSLDFEFRYTATGSEPSEPAVPQITWFDRAGNAHTEALQTSVQFDFSPPALTVVGPAISPPPGSLRGAAGSATIGSTVRVDVLAVDELAAPPEMRLDDMNGEEVSRVVGSVVDGGDFILEMEFDEGLDLADGDYRLWVEAFDALPGQSGNLVERDLGTLQFDGTAPNAPDVETPGTVTYRRIPWGEEKTDGLATFTLEAAAGAFVDDGDSFMVALDRKELASAIEIGRGAVQPDGSVKPFELVAADLARVFVAAVDRAGNVSDAGRENEPGLQGARVREVVWTATLNGKIRGSVVENPHGIQTTPLMIGTLEQIGGITEEPSQEEISALGREDGLNLTAQGDRVWLDRPVSLNTPSARNQHAVAYDAVRGSLVLFGGFDELGRSAETWEFDGSFWSRVAPPISPRSRLGHSMVFDPKRGVVVLFGGNHNGNLLNDTWIWDGDGWTQVGEFNPPGVRQYHGMAYDTQREVVVMFGGRQGNVELNDTWEWDGLNWQERSPAGDTPPARDSHAMAFDETTGTTVMYGGITTESSSFLNEAIWDWNGFDWKRYPLVGERPVPQRNSMAYDPEQKRILLFGESTWHKIDNQWQRLSPAREPSGREYPALTFANGLNGILMYGGGRGNDCVTGDCLGDLWLWDGSTWIALTEGEPDYPPSRDRMVSIYHDGLGRFLMFGGFALGEPLNDFWMWSGASWLEATSFGPSARFRSSATYDPAQDRLYLFGGLDPDNVCNPKDATTSHCGDLWSWDVANGWVDRTPAQPSDPEPRSAPAVAFDTNRNRLVLYGGAGCAVGVCTNATCGETWEFDPEGSWTRMTSTNNPPALSRHAMVYDEARERVVLFGGVTDANPGSAPCGTDGVSNETWEWGLHGATVCGSISTPCWQRATVVGDQPAERASHSLAYDSLRRRVVLFGGQTDDVNERFGDTWEWNGARWRHLDVAAAAPTERFGQGLAYDPVRKKFVLFGGVGETSTWELEANDNQRPAAIIAFDLAFLRSDISTIDDIAISVRATGRGYTTAESNDGELVVGASVSLWSSAAGRWIEVGNSVGNVLDYATASVAEAQSFAAPDDKLYIAVQPSAGIGNGSVAPDVSIDYAELVVTMRR